MAIFYDFELYKNALTAMSAMVDELDNLQLALKDDPELEYNPDTLALYNFIAGQKMAIEMILKGLSTATLGTVLNEKKKELH